MNYHFRKKFLAASLMAAGACAAAPALAQSSNTGFMALEEIVVTARRRDESLQDVPVTVNAVTSEQLDELNVRKFEDLQGIVAGLTLQEDSIAANASVRGVRFDTFASGNNPTVEFYLNDAPISSLQVMQALFDVGQIEVLRGPQGTLRGRASPSGSITITSQKPVMDEVEGYIDLTATDIGGQNVRGAVNVPIIENMLAVRAAGFWEENNNNDVKSAYTGERSEYEGQGFRFSVGFEPTDNIAMNLMYQKVEPDRDIYFPVESANIANSNLGPSDIFIDGDDRLSVQDDAEHVDQSLETLNFNISWEFAGQQLNYVYAQNESSVDRESPFGVDQTNAIDANHPATAWQGLFQGLKTSTEDDSHEIRLQSVEPLFDKLDYIVGYFTKNNEPGSNVINRTPLAIFFPTGAPAPNDYVGPVAYSVASTPIFSGGESEEQSFFFNLTYALTDSTEISGGARRIDFEEDRNLIVDGTKLIGAGNVFGPTGDDGHGEWEETIYSFAIKHNFTEDLMAYFSYGTSWRPGINAVGDFSFLKSALQESFQVLPPEESESFEIGMRSSWMDERLRLNVSAFHQEFDNYPYRAGGAGIQYISYAVQRDGQGNPIGLAPEQADFNFVAAVPVEVNGIEIEAFFQATDSWDVGALFSYAKGEIEDGFVPCNDYLPNDGVPDSGGSVPTITDIANATGGLFVGDNVTGCSANFRSNNAPLWTTTLTSQYNFPLGDMEAYVRGLWTFYGDSENDPTYSVDDIDSYNTLNLYLGATNPEGTWEAMIYGKNILDTVEVTQRDASPGSLAFTGIDAVAQGSVTSLAGSVVSDYRVIGLTAPREFGINFRYNF